MFMELNWNIVIIALMVLQAYGIILCIKEIKRMKQEEIIKKQRAKRIDFRVGA